MNEWNSQNRLLFFSLKFIIIMVLLRKFLLKIRNNLSNEKYDLDTNVLSLIFKCFYNIKKN